jgi:hypothetical protein
MKMAWKLHELSEDLYKNLRYDRIRFVEETKRKGGAQPHAIP